jgi:hypothetical protein
MQRPGCYNGGNCGHCLILPEMSLGVVKCRQVLSSVVVLRTSCS